MISGTGVAVDLTLELGVVYSAPAPPEIFSTKSKLSFLPPIMRLEFEPNATALPFVESEAVESAERAESVEVRALLADGIKAAQSGNRSHARTLLMRATELDARCEAAWLWLASISEYPEELLVFLKNVLEISPENERALQWSAATKSLLAKTFVQRGIEASKDNQNERALEYFDQALAYDEQNQMAWLWIASLSDSKDRKIEYLERVLSIDPQNEEAQTAMLAARQHDADALLKAAKSAAVAGEKEKAIGLIDEMLEHFPDSEDGWILRSHVADNFEEKIRSFEKALEINPTNFTAEASLESLRAIMETVAPDAPAETAAEPFVSDEIAQMPEHTNGHHAPEELEFMIGESHQESPEDEDAEPAQESADEEIEQPVYEKIDTSDEPEDLTQQYSFSDMAALNLPSEPANLTQQFTAGDITMIGYTLPDSEPEPAAAEEPDDEPSEDIHKTMVANTLPWESEDEAESSEAKISDEIVQEADVDIHAIFDDGIPMPFDDAGLKDDGFVSRTFDTLSRTAEFKNTATDGSTCPYCKSGIEAYAFVCYGCMATLTLADLEMLLANQPTNVAAIKASVDALEAEKSSRKLTETELITLAIGHLNLHNLKAGFSCLHEASQQNPNNVVLSGQVNSLAIRLEEINRQMETSLSMPKGKKILVVDDSATVRKLISGKLEKCGHAVFCAVDGVDAIEMIDDMVPDLVLLDITMPRMDGYQVCKAIRSKESTKDVPVVMISGKDGFFDKVRGRMAGTSGYITKPFGPETLMKTLETYLTHD